MQTAESVVNSIVDLDARAEDIRAKAAAKPTISCVGRANRRNVIVPRTKRK